MKVNWPSSRAVANAGFIDAFRQLRPDEVGDRAETWTPGYPAPNLDPDEVHDRIDFVYATPERHSDCRRKFWATTLTTATRISASSRTRPITGPSSSNSMLPACSLFGDLNGNCGIDTADWAQFRSGQHANLFGLTPSEAMAMGDLNGDFHNDHTDFVIFKNLYEDAHGLGSFAHMLSVPEPASILLVALAWCVAPIRSRRRRD